LEGLTLPACLGKSLCWARSSSKLPPLLAWVGAALERGGSAYPHICPSRSSKLQKGDSPRRKSSRGKCSCHTQLPSSFGFNFSFKLSAMLGPRWGTWSPSLSSDVWPPSSRFSSLSPSTVNLLDPGAGCQPQLQVGTQSMGLQVANSQPPKSCCLY